MMPSDDREFHSPGFRTENLEQYAEGGFHPVRVGSTFRRRYHMKGKIGYGGCGTVWWARDSVEQRHVAVKILTAHASKKFDKLRTFYYHRPGEDRVPNHPGRRHIAKLISTFWHRGPNGNHLCLVLELAGPKIEDYLKSRPTGGLKLAEIQKMALESAKAMAYLHANRFVHGDLTINNIFLTIRPPHTWTSLHLLHLERLHATIMSVPLERLDGDPAHPQGPRAITSCTPLHRLPPETLTSSITVGDLDASFPADDPPEDVFILPPLNYCAPELLKQIIPRPPDMQTDVWSLGCTIFAMRAGRALFKRPRDKNVDIMLLQMQGVLGDSPVIQALFQEGRELVDEHVRLRDLAHSLIAQNSKPLRQLISEIGQGYDEKGKELAFLKTIPESEELSTSISETEGGKNWMSIPTCPAEVDSLYDLLSKMLQYDLEKRIAVEEVVKHPWFTTDFGF